MGMDCPIIYMFMHSLRYWKFFIFLLENMSEVLRKAGWPVLRICVYKPCWFICTELSRLIWSSSCLQEQRQISHHTTSDPKNTSCLSLIFDPRSFWHLTGRWNIPVMHSVSYEESWWYYCVGWCHLTGQLVPPGERFSCTFFDTHHDACLYWS